MKLPFPISDGRSAARSRGFTLPELLIALTVFLFVIIGIVFANLFGLSMFKMNETKLNVTRWSRETIEHFTDEIHTCSSVQVGYMTNSSSLSGFAGFMNGETQQGNALLIYPTTNTANYIVYFVNPADQTFRRTDQTDSTVILADSVTNAAPFSTQDLSGKVLTNIVNNQVVHLTLEFYQPQLFMQAANYYKLETAVAQRVVQ